MRESVTWPPQSGCQERRMLALSSLSPVRESHVQDLRPWDDGSAYVQDESSLPQLVQSRNYLTNVLRGLSPR